MVTSVLSPLPSEKTNQRKIEGTISMRGPRSTHLNKVAQFIKRSRKLDEASKANLVCFVNRRVLPEESAGEEKSRSHTSRVKLHKLNSLTSQRHSSLENRLSTKHTGKQPGNHVSIQLQVNRKSLHKRTADLKPGKKIVHYFRGDQSIYLLTTIVLRWLSILVTTAFRLCNNY